MGNGGRPAGGKILAYLREFTVLRQTRREFWGIQIVNLLDCTYYFAMLTMASLFMSDDLHMSDKAAGRAIAVFTSATSILLIFSGAVCDWLGIRRSLRASMWAMLLLRLAVVAVGLLPGLPHRGLLVAALLLLMSPFIAAIQTVVQAGTKRFTTSGSRGAGFNLWYLFTNIGAALAGYWIDFARLHLRVANVHIFTMGAVTAILCLIFTALLVRNEEQLGGEEAKRNCLAFKPARSPLEILRDVASQPALLRLLVLIALVLGVRAVYAYRYLLMPKYWERTIGADAAIGALNMINPIGIVIGLIIFIPFANKCKVLNLLILGSAVSATSLFCLALPWRIFGVGIAEAHYIMAILCMIFLTVGEVMWSPKLYEFVASIAPRGQEGTYLGFSMIPWFLAKSLAGWFSGNLLQHWSPERVSERGETIPLQQALQGDVLDYWHTPAAMWLWLGSYALLGCVIAALVRNWLGEGAHFEPAPAAASPGP